MPKDNASIIVGWIVIIVLVAIAIPGLIYYGALILRPYLILFAVLFTLVAIGSLVGLYFTWEEDYTPIVLIVFIVSGVLAILSFGGIAITGDIIESVPNSTEGQASIALINDTIQLANIPNEISQTFQTALNQQTEDICKQQDEQVCQMTKNIVSTYENTQELQDWISKGNRLIDFVEKHKPSI